MTKRLMHKAAKLAGLALAFLLSAPVLTHHSPAFAQNVSANSEFQTRSEQIVEILSGSKEENSFFAPIFLDAVPVPQFRKLAEQLITQYGQPQSIRGIVVKQPSFGTVDVQYKKAILAFQMAVSADSPHKVIGLRVVGVKTPDDSFVLIKKDFSALKGMAGFVVYRFGNDQGQIIAGLQEDEQFAIGSGFKLYVLSELIRSIKSGERQWSDTVILKQKSLPSGIIQNWPAGTPMTLQTLATLMVSISDNTATDTLVRLLGRGAIEKQMALIGHSDFNKATPFLTTTEAFALKMQVNSDIREAMSVATEEQQIQLLEANQDRLTIKQVNASELAGKPKFIETIEWFASPNDIVKLLQYIHQQDDEVATSILAINSGVAAGDAARWRSLGHKSGSETGVIHASFLGFSQKGQNFVITGSWNNNEEPVDKAKFSAMMTRLLNQAAN